MSKLEPNLTQALTDAASESEPIAPLISNEFRDESSQPILADRSYEEELNDAALMLSLQRTPRKFLLNDSEVEGVEIREISTKDNGVVRRIVFEQFDFHRWDRLSSDIDLNEDDDNAEISDELNWRNPWEDILEGRKFSRIRE